MAEPINRRSVDPVDTSFEGRMNPIDRFLIILGTPTPRPTAAAHRPGAQANARDLKLALTKYTGFHHLSLTMPNLIPVWQAQFSAPCECRLDLPSRKSLANSYNPRCGNPARIILSSSAISSQ